MAHMATPGGRGQVEMRGQHRSLLCPKPIYKTKTEDTKTPETTQRFGTLQLYGTLRTKCKVLTTSAVVSSVDMSNSETSLSSAVPTNYDTNVLTSAPASL